MPIQLNKVFLVADFARVRDRVAELLVHPAPSAPNAAELRPFMFPAPASSMSVLPRESLRVRRIPSSARSAALRFCAPASSTAAVRRGSTPTEGARLPDPAMVASSRLLAAELPDWISPSLVLIADVIENRPRNPRL